MMELLEAAGALAAVLTLIWLSAKAARLTKLVRTNQRSNKSLEIAEVLTIDSQRRLVLINCENDRRVLLMVGGRQDFLVGWLGGKGPGT